MATIGPFSEPIPTEMMKHVAAVVPRVEIRDIRLTRISSVLASHPPADGSATEVNLGHESEVTIIQDDALSIGVSFSLSAKPQGTEDDRIFTQLSVTFQLTYSGENLSTIDDEARTAFADVNAVHTSWPYFRELVQNITTRMGIPAMVVPLLKVRQREKAPD